MPVDARGQSQLSLLRTLGLGLGLLLDLLRHWFGGRISHWVFSGTDLGMGSLPGLAQALVLGWDLSLGLLGHWFGDDGVLHWVWLPDSA